MTASMTARMSVPTTGAPHRARTTATPTDKLPVVNGLRGLAILGVIFHHSFCLHFEAGADQGEWARLLAPLLGNGWIGVDLFFVLSGFVLYLPYATGSRSLAGSGWRLFYRRRFLRLAPLFLLVALVSTVFNAPGSIVSANFYAYAISLLSGLFPALSRSFMPPANWVLWSVGVEIWFSVIFPLVVLILHRRGAPALLGGAILLAVVVRAAGYFWFEGSREYINSVSASVFGRLDEFVLGMVVAAFYGRRGSAAISAAALPAGLVLLGLSLFGWTWWRAGGGATEAGALLTLASAVGCALILLGLLRHPADGLMAARPLQLMGMMCYSLYAWHIIVLQGLLPSGWVIGALPASPAYATYLVILFAIAALTYRYVEFRAADDWRALFLLNPPAARTVPGARPARMEA